MKKQFDTLLEFENLECIVKVYKSSSVITIIFKFNKKGGREIWYEKINSIVPLNIDYENINKDLLVLKKVNHYGKDYFGITKTSDKSNWQKFNAMSDFQNFVLDSFYGEDNI